MTEKKQPFSFKEFIKTSSDFSNPLIEDYGLVWVGKYTGELYYGGKGYFNVLFQVTEDTEMILIRPVTPDRMILEWEEEATHFLSKIPKNQVEAMAFKDMIFGLYYNETMCRSTETKVMIHNRVSELYSFKTILRRSRARYERQISGM